MNELSTIIVPFFNEDKFLKGALTNLISEQFEKEIILVNDGSTDGSLDIALQFQKSNKDIKIISFSQNRGKGFAIKAGVEQSKGEIIGIYDADQEYSSADLSELVSSMREEELDFILGSRFIGNKNRMNIYLRTFIANKLLSSLFSIVHRNKITDIATCLKLFRKDLIHDINFESDGFSIEVELIAKVLKQTKNFKELPISYSGRSYEDGKKIKLIDGFMYVYSIFKFKI